MNNFNVLIIEINNLVINPALACNERDDIWDI